MNKKLFMSDSWFKKYWIYPVMAVTVLVSMCVIPTPVKAQSELLDDLEGKINRIKGCSSQMHIYMRDCVQRQVGPIVEECMKDHPLRSEAQIGTAIKKCHQIILPEKLMIGCRKDQFDRVQACMQLYAKPSIHEEVQEEIEREIEDAAK